MPGRRSTRWSRSARSPSARPQRVVLAPLASLPPKPTSKYIGGLLDGLPVVAGDRIRAPLFGNRSADFQVAATTPAGPVVIDPTTELERAGRQRPSSRGSRRREVGRPLSYEDIGGLKRELHRIREIIELPLRYPEVFERLGIDPPKGVLLHGPPGCGKTLIARAVAHETDAQVLLDQRSGDHPQVLRRERGAPPQDLRGGRRQAPSIIFLDEIDAIAPRREKVVGDVEKRVVAQLLALMDGLAQRAHVIVIAATNLPNALDPALRRPGRFDREIAISIPDRDGRREILEIHSRGMPLAADVDLAHLAAITHGFVGRRPGGALPRGGDDLPAAGSCPRSTSRSRPDPVRDPADARSRDGRLRGGAVRGRALGHPRGVRRGSRRRAGTMSAAWMRSSSS